MRPILNIYAVLLNAQTPLHMLSQGVVSLTFRELSKTISRKYTMSEITFMVRIWSWNFVHVPKAWLWAHIQIFSFKLSYEVRFLQYTNFERISWRAHKRLVKQPPGSTGIAMTLMLANMILIFVHYTYLSHAHVCSGITWKYFVKYFSVKYTFVYMYAYIWWSIVSTKMLLWRRNFVLLFHHIPNGNDAFVLFILNVVSCTRVESNHVGYYSMFWNVI